MKKIMAVALILAIVLGLVGCSTIEEQTNPKDSSSTTSQNESESAETGEESSDSIILNQSLASFSYEEDVSIYTAGDPGVNPNAFVNTDTYPIENQNAAVERAQNECTIDYNSTSEYYDSNADMWRIDFFTIIRNEDGSLVAPGGCQSVYMNSDGITQLIVYGE